MRPTHFVGEQIEFIRHRHRNPNLVLALRPDRLQGVPPDRVIWGDTADRLPNIDALRQAGAVVQNVTPTVVATSPDDLDQDFTRAQLQQMCEAAGLPTSGTKAELQARLDEVDVETTFDVEVEQGDEE